MVPTAFVSGQVEGVKSVSFRTHHGPLLSPDSWSCLQPTPQSRKEVARPESRGGGRGEETSRVRGNRNPGLKRMAVPQAGPSSTRGPLTPDLHVPRPEFGSSTDVVGGLKRGVGTSGGGSSGHTPARCPL